MKRVLIISLISIAGTGLRAQSNPAITSWLINTTGAKGSYYLDGNATPITHTGEANVQEVSYSANYVYVKATGIPAYTTGPYYIGTIDYILDNAYTIKLPLNPVEATTKTSPGGGAIAVFIDGTVAYRARDAASYNNENKWHQNAVYFENIGFDCAHGHPGPMTSDYHTHQIPAAFNISSVPTSDICNVYLSDGLYVPDPTAHGPLIGFAADGFPIYAAFGYSDPTDPTSSIQRMRSGYSLRNITSRTTLPNGTAATGPALTEIITSPLPGSTPLQASLGAYEEDYEYIAGSGDLDEYNGRFCITPEYPAGIYCYFATIDAAYVPEYPYIVGNYYYGTAPAMGPPGSSFTKSTITESVTQYDPSTTIADMNLGSVDARIFPNPTQDLIVVQSTVAKNFDRQVELIDPSGKLITSQTINIGSTMCYFETDALPSGTYSVRISGGNAAEVLQVVLSK